MRFGRIFVLAPETKDLLSTSNVAPEKHRMTYYDLAESSQRKYKRSNNWALWYSVFHVRKLCTYGYSNRVQIESTLIKREARDTKGIFI